MPSPTLYTLLQLRTAARQHADMVNSQFVTDAELTQYVNSSYAELYDVLIQKYGDNYFVKTPAYTFATNGTADQYALPDDFYKLLGVDLAITATPDGYVSLSQFEFADRNKFSIPNMQSFFGITTLRYKLNNNNLWFTPLPSANQTIRLWYVPKVVYMVGDSDTIDGVSGWEEYVIIDAAIKMKQKEESDVSVLMAQKEAMLRRIESAAENRNAGAPPKVVDAQYNDFGYPTGGGSGFGYGIY